MLLFISVFFCLSFFVNCIPSRVSLLPLPSKIDSIEGYASIRITGEQEKTRSKFSFLFHLPNQGRIEVSNWFGKTLYQIVIVEKSAFFVLPSKRVYWQGEEEEIIQKFLGFRVNLYEMISFLSGQWGWNDITAEREVWLESWNLEKDEKGRVLAGQREDLFFEVQEFFKDTPFARALIFRHPLSRGRHKVLKIKLNQPIKKEAFSVAFLEKFKEKSWAEIEKMFDKSDEN
ncbi:MAG: hypothetical protein JSV96_16570 [Candidatus Aminicenantes bacterium]|nr:MAG: hypothetical protein JSV96_16570 [Candidatus Aminicenantes bacterium]